MRQIDREREGDNTFIVKIALEYDIFELGIMYLVFRSFEDGKIVFILTFKTLYGFISINLPSINGLDYNNTRVFVSR